MSMPTERDLMGRSVKHQMPKSTKRTSPVASDPTKVERDDKKYVYGAPFLVRVHPDTIAAVEQAVKKHNVQKGSFVDFLIRASLYQLETGRMTLPVIENNDRARKVTLPDLP